MPGKATHLAGWGLGGLDGGGVTGTKVQADTAWTGRPRPPYPPWRARSPGVPPQGSGAYLSREEDWAWDQSTERCVAGTTAPPSVTTALQPGAAAPSPPHPAFPQHRVSRGVRAGVWAALWPQRG